MSTNVENLHDHEHTPSGIMRWITTTNHKDIGTLYLWFSLLMFFVGGFMALIIRAELFEPGLQLVVPGFFNQMTTMHALIMIFGAVMPAFVGLANWQIPLMIGAPDMAISGAPIIRGICQFASPTKAGITAPKIIINACIVVIWLKNPGTTNCKPGSKSSALIIKAIKPPTKNISKLNHRYKVPMSL